MRHPQLLLVVVVAGCAFAPPDAQRIDPPPLYRQLYDSAEACTGRRGNFDALTFFVVPGYSFECKTGECVGHFEGNTVWLAEDWRNHRMVVLHELIHSLGIMGHPDSPFKTPCRAMWGSSIHIDGGQ